MLCPHDLNFGFGLTKNQGEYVNSTLGTGRNMEYHGFYVHIPVGGNVQINGLSSNNNNATEKEFNIVGKSSGFKPTVPIQKVSLDEMKERKNKGLC